MNKKSQITIFIIVAIILVFGMGIFLFIKLKTTETETSTLNPENYIAECMKEAAEESVEIISEQGGFLNPENYILYKNKTISYTCYNENYYQTCIMQTPTLINSEKEQIKKYIEPRVENCFESLKEQLEERNYEIDFGEIKLEVELAPEKINLNADVSFVMTKNEEIKKFENFETELNSYLYNFAELSQEISNQEAKFCNFEYLGYMLLHPEFVIEKDDINGEAKIYTLIKKSTGEQFRFAVRSCAMPSGM